MEDTFRDRNGEALDVRFEGSARRTFLSLVEMVERGHRLVLAEGAARRGM